MNLLETLKTFVFGTDKMFQIGQEVARINDGRWINEDGKQFIGPAFSEVVRVREYDRFCKGRWYIKLEEYPHSYSEREFAPVMTDDQLEEQVNAIDELIVTKGGW